MSASKKDDSKTKIPVDDNVDSGFLSGPIDHYVDEEYEKDENNEKDEKNVKDENVLCCDSGIIDDDKLAERAKNEKDENVLYCDSGIIDDDKLAERVDTMTLVDTSIPTPTEPEERAIPARHLAIFFQPDDDGDTQLHIASIHGCEKSVATLIKICPNKAILDLTNNHGHTPLHLAVMSRNAVVTRMLVRAGLSIEVRDRTGETPLHKATSVGHLECLQALLAPVSDQPPRRLASALNQKNYRGQACVHLAASLGYLEALQTLVYFKADINARENLAGWTALHIAARRGDVRMVQYLRDRCAGVALDAEDYAGRTPRRLAKHTPAARLFANDGDSEDDSDFDDDAYESDTDESLFERLCESRGQSTFINVA